MHEYYKSVRKSLSVVYAFNTIEKFLVFMSKWITGDIIEDNVTIASPSLKSTNEIKTTDSKNS